MEHSSGKDGGIIKGLTVERSPCRMSWQVKYGKQQIVAKPTKREAVHIRGELAKRFGI